jgi:hypothetical protein
MSTKTRFVMLFQTYMGISTGIKDSPSSTMTKRQKKLNGVFPYSNAECISAALKRKITGDFLALDFLHADGVAYKPKVTSLTLTNEDSYRT